MEAGVGIGGAVIVLLVLGHVLGVPLVLAGAGLGLWLVTGVAGEFATPPPPPPALVAPPAPAPPPPPPRKPRR